MIVTLYFSEDGKTVNVEYYSTVRNQYYSSRNQFSFKVNTIAREGETSEQPEDVRENIFIGCSGSVASSISSVSILMCAIYVFKKRKNQLW